MRSERQLCHTSLTLKWECERETDTTPWYLYVSAPALQYFLHFWQMCARLQETHNIRLPVKSTSILWERRCLWINKAEELHKKLASAREIIQCRKTAIINKPVGIRNSRTRHVYLNRGKQQCNLRLICYFQHCRLTGMPVGYIRCVNPSGVLPYDI